LSAGKIGDTAQETEAGRENETWGGGGGGGEGGTLSPNRTSQPCTHSNTHTYTYIRTQTHTHTHIALSERGGGDRVCRGLDVRREMCPHILAIDLRRVEGLGFRVSARVWGVGSGE
jgi:hypothetical protein